MADADDTLLSAEEAAVRFGITPELLFAYVRNAPKRSCGHDRRLAVVQRDGETFFQSRDLADFDAYLREPWSAPGEGRPPIPQYVQDYLRVECAGGCARCRRGFPLEIAHIEDYAASRSHHHHNLIRLCANCHGEFDSKKILVASELRELKRTLIVRLQERGNAAARRNAAAGHVPTPATGFCGREGDVRQLREALKAHRVVSVQGPGGIGKTELLLHALDRRPATEAQPAPDVARTLWLSVEDLRDVSAIDTALRIALFDTAADAAGPLGPLLDSEPVRLVIDGLERVGSGGALDAIEDYIATLVRHTRATRFVLTTQADLGAIDVGHRMRLGPLDGSSSAAVLARAADRSLDAEDPAAVTALLAFCEGHPLALRLVGGLVRHHGSASRAEARLRQHRSAAVRVPGRSKHSHATSLEACLRVAYDALTHDERRVMYLLAHCPAGAWPEMIEAWSHGVADVHGAVATLGRWHLLTLRRDAASSGPALDRAHSLSPIRAFIRDRFAEDDVAGAAALTLELVKGWTIHAAVLDMRHMQAGDVAWGATRFRAELPNFLAAFDAAVERAKRSSVYLGWVADLAKSLMVFCFVAGLFRRGYEMMRAGADAALQAGDRRAAATLLLQAAVLAERAHADEWVREAAKLIDSLPRDSNTDDDRFVGVRAASARGLLAMTEGRYDDAELEHAAAEALYLADRDPRGSDDEPDADDADGPDEQLVATAIQGRAFACERAGRFTEAIGHYERALAACIRHGDAVNYGAIVHQQGNCLAYLGQHAAAYDAYARSAGHFHSIGSAEYLSNSLSELGYLLIDYQSDALDADVPGPLIEAGLDDVGRQALLAFAPSESNLPAAREVVRKTFGMIILASFTAEACLLGAWASEMRDQVLRPLVATIDTSRPFDGLTFQVMRLDLSLMIAVTLSSQPRHSKAENDWITGVAGLCFGLLDLKFEPLRAFDWLAAYLRRCRGTSDATAWTLYDTAKAGATRGRQ